MKKNRISVLMTVYNTEKYLNNAIKSVLKQTYKNFELIIVDDKSTDNSRKIIRKYKSTKIKKFFLKKHIGRPKSLNYALKKSGGEFIAILDSDDISYKDRFKTQIKFLLKREKVMLVASMIDFVNDNGTQVEVRPSKNEVKNFSNIIHYKNIFPFSSVLFRKKILKKLGNFSNNLNYAQDYHFILRVKKIYEISLIPKILGQVRSRSDNLSSLKNLFVDRKRDLIDVLKFSKNNFPLSFKLKMIISIKIILELFKIRLNFFKILLDR